MKSLASSYDAGRRGAGWVKVKPAPTLDLVVLAVEWGSGRRKGLLSNLHLGARDPESGGFVMQGKTFKGLTDATLEWQTKKFQELAVERSDWVVKVRPESRGRNRVRRAPKRAPPTRAFGAALCAREALSRDKPASDADTIQFVRECSSELTSVPSSACASCSVGSCSALARPASLRRRQPALAAFRWRASRASTATRRLRTPTALYFNPAALSQARGLHLFFDLSLALRRVSYDRRRAPTTLRIRRTPRVQTWAAPCWSIRSSTRPWRPRSRSGT